jgi:hypothetical protein
MRTALLLFACNVQVDVRNPRILASHLMCAALEQPLDCSAAAAPAGPGLGPAADAVVPFAAAAAAAPFFAAGAPASMPLTVAGARDAALFGANKLWVSVCVCVCLTTRLVYMMFFVRYEEVPYGKKLHVTSHMLM